MSSSSLISSFRPLQLGVELIVSIGVCYFVCFTFGAPLIDDFAATLAFSTLLACIGLMPMFVLVPHKDSWMLAVRILAKREFENRSEEMCANVAYGGALGAWFGCFVLPLDWDRWWQQWPTPCCFGAVFGASLAFLYFGVLRGSRLFKKKTKD